MTKSPVCCLPRDWDQVSAPMLLISTGVTLPFSFVSVYDKISRITGKKNLFPNVLLATQYICTKFEAIYNCYNSNNAIQLTSHFINLPNIHFTVHVHHLSSECSNNVVLLTIFCILSHKPTALFTPKQLVTYYTEHCLICLNRQQNLCIICQQFNGTLLERLTTDYTSPRLDHTRRD